MDLKKSNHIENPDRQKEELTNLDSLSFEFCDNDLVSAFYDKKLRSLADKEKWLEKNKENLEQNKDKIIKAVEDGLIADTKPETIRQLQVNKAKEGQEKMIDIKNRLENSIDEIKTEVAKKLSKYLPDWTAKKAKIIFIMNKKADFYIDRNTITVDLGRLLFEQNPVEKVKEGIIHEIVHLWMSERSKWSDSEQDKVSIQDLKDEIVFKTVDEGLAVLISGQSLELHHAKQGKDFVGYKNESFKSFNHFLSGKDREVLEKIKNEKFQNMGHFYVVGNEIATTILQYDGIEKFKKQIIEARDNPLVFLQRYREICNKNTNLPKINS